MLSQALRQPSPREPVTVLVLDLKIVVILSPVVSNEQHPATLQPTRSGRRKGGVATGLQRDFSATQRESLDAAEAAGVFTYKTIGQGAATTLVAAIAPEFAGVGGRYLDDCREAYTVPDDATLAEHPHGVKQWALDPSAADQLWRRSLDMTI